MVKVLALVLLLMSGWLTYQGVTVWSHCGYDCPLGLTWIRLSATTALIVGAIGLLLGLSSLATLLPGGSVQESLERTPMSLTIRSSRDRFAARLKW